MTHIRVHITLDDGTTISLVCEHGQRTSRPGVGHVTASVLDPRTGFPMAGDPMGWRDALRPLVDAVRDARAAGVDAEGEERALADVVLALV